MSGANAALRSHLKGDVTTTCHCWIVTRRDGVTLGFSDHDRRLIIEGIECRPESGFSASEARDRLGLGVDTVDVDGALSSLEISDADIVAGLYDGAGVATWLVNWCEPEQRELLRRAVIGKIERQDGAFSAELLSLAESLDHVSGRLIRRSCDAVLGDKRCGVDLGDERFRSYGSVQTCEGSDVLLVSLGEDHETGWFSQGTLTWTNGAHLGRVERIIDHARRLDSIVLTLWRAGESFGEPGDQFTLTAGCDRQFETCKAKFGNGLNFRGFPHLPGNDAAYGYVTDGVSFDGKPIVP